MNCEYCHLVIGQDYRGVGVMHCAECGTPCPDTDGAPMKYVEYTGDHHIFRVFHTIYCDGCGTALRYIANPCANSDYEQELAKLFGIPYEVAHTV